MWVTHHRWAWSNMNTIAWWTSTSRLLFGLTIPQWFLPIGRRVQSVGAAGFRWTQASRWPFAGWSKATESLWSSWRQYFTVFIKWRRTATIEFPIGTPRNPMKTHLCSLLRFTLVTYIPLNDRSELFIGLKLPFARDWSMKTLPSRHFKNVQNQTHQWLADT